MLQKNHVKYIAITLTLALLIFITVALSSIYRINFKDFEQYENDYRDVVSFIRTNFNSDEPIVLNIKDGYLYHGDEAVSDDSLCGAVNQLSKKGFTFANITDEYIVFWQDETGYYGIMWAEYAESAVRKIYDTRQYMKAHKLADNWYEIGALNSI